MKVIWLSRHTLTEDQRSCLREQIGESDIQETNVVWSMSKNEGRDNAENAEIWKRLASEAEVIVGIFPPPSLVGLVTARGIASGDDEKEDKEWERVLKIRVMTPVSEVGTLLTPGKCARKSFKFLRWQEL